MKLFYLALFLFSISCTYNEYVVGCIDSNATNYDVSATVDDGSCTYSFVECTTLDEVPSFDL